VNILNKQLRTADKGRSSSLVVGRDFKYSHSKNVVTNQSQKGTGEWRRQHNKDIYDFYASSDIIRAIESRRLRWEENGTRMWERRGA
jgi:hypothetical protein